jgi:hypothetical protein
MPHKDIDVRPDRGSGDVELSIGNVSRLIPTNEARSIGELLIDAAEFADENTKQD